MNKDMKLNTDLGMQFMPIIMAASSVLFYALGSKWLCGSCLFFSIMSWAVLVSENTKK